MEEKPILVESWIRREKVWLSPFSESTKQTIKDMGGVIKTNHDEGGFRYKITFPGHLWGASVVKSKWHLSVQGRDLFELGVMDSSGHLTYDTEITNDVVYNLTDEDVLTLLRLIKRLDKHGKIKRLNSSQTAQGL